MSTQQSLLVLGATGQTGRHFTRLALAVALLGLEQVRDRVEPEPVDVVVRALPAAAQAGWPTLLEDVSRSCARGVEKAAA
ncbi:hypothetical protein IAE22_30470 [Bacillus sp. S34]|nr:hypothetical protein [Bacillus sp. S34]